MRILGIDPGTAITGWGVIDADGANDLKLVDYGAITTPAKTPNSERLLSISKEMVKLIKKFEPELCSVEKLFFSNNAKTAMTVGEARGVVLLELERKNIPIVEFTPNEIKEGVCGYGKADKKQVQMMVRSILEMEEVPKPDDAADGIAAAICGASRSNLENKIREASE